MEKWVVKIEAQQRKSVGVAPSEEEQSKEMVKSFIWGSSSESLFSFKLIILFLFPKATYPGTLPWVHTHPSARIDLEVKSSGRSKTHCSWHYLLSFEPQEDLLCMCGVSLVPKEWGTKIP